MAKIKWKDASRGARNEEVSVWETAVGDLRICVHRLWGVKDTWYLSVAQLREFDQHMLQAKGHEAAKREAIRCVRRYINRLHRKLAKMEP